MFMFKFLILFNGTWSVNELNVINELLSFSQGFISSVTKSLMVMPVGRWLNLGYLFIATVYRLDSDANVLKRDWL